MNSRAVLRNMSDKKQSSEKTVKKQADLEKIPRLLQEIR
jgi:hypothetical protein